MTTTERVERLLAQMTLAEKIGQMTQVEKNSITPAEVAEYGVGSVLSGGGGGPTPNTPAAWAEMVRGFQEGALQSRLSIPLLYGVDAVHGHGNLCGAVIFPHNVGLGATRDPLLIERIAQVTARELLATGVNWNFAPAVSVPQDIRWGRTYEGFSEDPGLVSELGAAYVRGLQAAAGAAAPGQASRVLASVKHYVGDGGTRWGTPASRYPWLKGLWEQTEQQFQLDQGETIGDEATLRAIHLAPYVAAIAAGARNIMVSYSSWGGLKLHAHHYLLTDVLKGELGFSGFLVSDWQAIDQLSIDYDYCVVTAINAGLDMVMVPHDFRRFLSTLTRAVERGAVPLSRIDDAVRRILTVKAEFGLFNHPLTDQSLLAQVGCCEHRSVAREAVSKSLVVLKNEQATLPIARSIATIEVAGAAADDLGMQCGGWTIAWQGLTGRHTEGTTIVEGIRQAVGAETEVRYLPDGQGLQQTAGNGHRADLGIVVVGEEPYAEGKGDRSDLSLSDADRALIRDMRARSERLLLIVIAGRPLTMTAEIALADAVVAAWLPGTEGQGVVDVLFGDQPAQGKLPYCWPRSLDQLAGAGAAEPPLYPYGYGLELARIEDEHPARYAV